MILRVVPNDTMSTSVLISRNVLRLIGYKLTKSPKYDKAEIFNTEIFITEIFNIDTIQYHLFDRVNISKNISSNEVERLKAIFVDCYITHQRSKEPRIHGG